MHSQQPQQPHPFRSPAGPRPQISDSLRQRIANIAGVEGKYRILGGSNSNNNNNNNNHNNNNNDNNNNANPSTVSTNPPSSSNKSNNAEPSAAAASSALNISQQPPKINRWNIPIPPREAAPKPPTLMTNGTAKAGDFTKSPLSSPTATAANKPLPAPQVRPHRQPAQQQLSSHGGGTSRPTLPRAAGGVNGSGNYNTIDPAGAAGQAHPMGQSSALKQHQRQQPPNPPPKDKDDTLPKSASAKDLADQNERLRIIEQTRARLLGLPIVNGGSANNHGKSEKSNEDKRHGGHKELRVNTLNAKTATPSAASTTNTSTTAATAATSFSNNKGGIHVTGANNNNNSSSNNNNNNNPSSFNATRGDGNGGHSKSNFHSQQQQQQQPAMQQSMQHRHLIPPKQTLGNRDSSQSSLSPRPKKESFFPARTVFNNLTVTASSVNDEEATMKSSIKQQSSSDLLAQPQSQSRNASPTGPMGADPLAKTLPRRPTLDEGTANARLKETEQKYSAVKEELDGLRKQFDKQAAESLEREKRFRQELDNALADQRRQFQEKLEQADERLNATKLQLEESQSTVRRFENERSEWQSEKDRLKSIETERGELKELCGAMQSRLEELETRINASRAEHKTAIDSLRQQHEAEVEQMKQETAKRVQRLKDRVISGEKERQASEEASRRDFEELLNAYDALQTEFDTVLVQAQSSNLYDNNNNNNNNNFKAPSPLSTDGGASSLETAAGRLAELTEQLAERDRQINDLMQTTNQQSYPVKYVANDKDLMDFIELMTQKTDSYRQELSKLQEENHSLRQHQNNGMASSSTTPIALAADEKHKEMSSFGDNQSISDNQRIQVQALRRDFESLSDRENRLQKEYDGLLTEFNRATLQVCEQDQENRELRDLTNKLRTEIQKLQEKLDEELSANLGRTGNSEPGDRNSNTAHMRAEFRRLLEEARNEYFESIKYEMEMRNRAERAMRNMKHERDMEIFAKHTATTQTYESHLLLATSNEPR